VILRTTMGASNANSFVNLGEADAYMAASSFRDRNLWIELGEEERENLLILAALIMSGMSWEWWPVYENQALPFPRWRYDTDTVQIPEAIKKAQTYIAWDIVYRNFQSTSSASDGALGDTIARFDLFGDVSITYGRSGAAEISIADGETWGDIINNDHLVIDLLLQKYRPQITISTALSDDYAPEFLVEVAATE
jgi:hypothetical protein